MPPWLFTVTGLGGLGLGVAGFVVGRFDRRRDDAMRFGEHWRAEAEALREENERMRQRIDDTENHYAAELAALRTENDALGKRLLQLLVQPPPHQGGQP